MASPCRGFVPAQPMAPGEYGACARCNEVVHDLRRMTEREVLALLERKRGQRLCVAYRTRADGSIVLRGESRTGVLALLLAAACAGHGPAAAELETCRDDDGTYVDCARSGPSWAFTAVPGEVAPPAPELARDPAPEREHDAEVAPPTDEIVREGVQTELVPVPEGEGCPPPWEADADADTVGILVRDDFVMTQGMVVGGIGAGRPSLRDRALARAQRREDRRIDREERRAARKARRAAR